jgi:hypothetical protein
LISFTRNRRNSQENLFRLYKPPNTDDITPERADLGLDLLEVGKIERDIAEKETMDKDSPEEKAACVVPEYDDIIKPVVSVKNTAVI